MPVKRLDALIRAVAEVRRQLPRTQLVIVGEGAEREHLDDVVAEVDAAEWVRFAGRVSDDTLVELYRAAWLVASASVAEGWGMTITEAAACGTPAVATDIGGHRDAVLDGRTGLLVAPSELAGGLTAILGDPGRRDELGRAAEQRAAGLSWEATAAGTLAVLAREAMRHAPTRPAPGDS